MADLMAKWSSFCITDKGLSLRQKAIAEGLYPRFTKAEIGQGVPSDANDVWTMTALIDFSQQVPVKKSYAKEVNHHIIVHIDNKDFPDEILMREIAIYAQLVDDKGMTVGGETLYGYSYTEHGYEPIPAGASFNRIWEISANTAISRASNVTVLYDGSVVYVTRDEFDAVQPTEEIATIRHNLNTLPIFSLYESEYAAGVGGYGMGPYGGSALSALPAKLVAVDYNTAKVFTIPGYAGTPEVSQVSPNMYSLVYPDGVRSLTLILR